MADIRRQLTLFVSDHSGTIESVRAEFNPEQFKLIPAHVTLCREEEIEAIDQVRANIRSLLLPAPIHINFGPLERSPDGKGVFMPAAGENKSFHEARKAILQGILEKPRDHQPHITLMHPRNSICTDQIFHHLRQLSLPTAFTFSTISLIQQKDGGKWIVLEEYPITG